MQVKCTNQQILDWLCGNEYAAAFYNTLWTVAQTWDDLVDKDKEVPEEAINNAFILALVDLKKNAFYLAYQKELDPLIILAISDWLDSVAYEKSKLDDQLDLAYSIRFSIVNLLIYSSFLLGGWSHMRTVSTEVRQMLMDTENLSEYKYGVNHA